MKLSEAEQIAKDIVAVGMDKPVKFRDRAHWLKIIIARLLKHECGGGE